MTIFHAIILGIVEGLTEFLPVSSTGHLMAAGELFGIAPTDFVKSFMVYIQLGAIAAVVFLYGRRGLASAAMLKTVAAAFIPTALVGLLAYPFIKAVLLENLLVVGVALMAGGIGLIVFERWYAKQAAHTAAISYRQAALIGLCQALAVIPGVSRSGATIIGGLLLGLDRKTIVEFSFLLAVPTMAAAAGLDLYKSDFTFTGSEWSLIAVGTISAFVTAILAIKFFLRYIQRHDFTAFGWYRIGAGLAILALISFSA